MHFHGSKHYAPWSGCFWFGRLLTGAVWSGSRIVCNIGYLRTYADERVDDKTHGTYIPNLVLNRGNNREAIDFCIKQQSCLLYYIFKCKNRHTPACSANSLDPALNWQNVGPNLDPKKFGTLIAFMKEYFEKVNLDDTKAWTLPSMQRVELS